MTCAYWVRYYNFNPKNGDRYFIQDFFTKEQLASLRSIITPRRIEKIKNQIHNLKEKDHEIEIQTLEEYLYSYIESDELEDFYFTNDSIFFDNENLLNKHDKFWDLDHITGFSIKEIQYLLNDFGKSAMLTGVGLENFVATIEPQT